MSVFSGNEGKKKGLAQQRPSDDTEKKKAISASLFIPVLCLVSLFSFSCLQRLIILPVPCPLYLSVESCSGGVRDRCRVFPLDFLLSTGSFSSFTFVRCLRFVYVAFCCHLLFYGGRRRQLACAGSYCISRSIVEGGQRIVPLICWCFCIIHPRRRLITSPLRKCGRN